MVEESTSREMHPVRSSLLIVAIFGAHGLAGFLNYAGAWRVVDRFDVNFGALYLFAGIAYFAAFSWMPWVHRRRIAKIALSVIAAFLSSWAYMVAALNTYGS